MIDMFLINLNRTEGQEEKLARWRKRKESITIYSFLFIFLILAIFTYNNHRAMSGLIVAKEQKIKRINRELEELAKQGRNVSKEDVLAIAQLEKTRFLWTKKFKALAEVLPKDVAVTGLEYGNNIFLIDFISRIRPEEKDFEKINEIMGYLQNTEDFYQEFGDIKFNKSHRITVDGQDILSFSVICKVRKTIKASKKEMGARRSM
jgi:Tfp pilus assembly protein PilN